ncbi:TrbM/KikA/MpfK family conjugal transfer protein [Campylobacter fetus]|uniref:TrbM/KikA/MpfK family conjugal transfer protein n=1 Tax=Campylobacter fetus TaxID=196 RepID=UPI0008187B32|nr:TrbM/KikA/MpfK family conjugal transfer protein [Campylobacter fetus]OCR84588.1 hypothetical protein CFT12S05168_09070 [Campylobacter fetus subsp. testudinum]OCR95675.1 hypothetical protein CFT12S02847_07665 [Campylobacter fetus subsp. testudinum]
MKKNIILILTIAFSSNAFSEELSGDTKLACEAILCLSSSTRPAECSPSIFKFYSISAKKMADTIKKRKAFLNLCPVGSAAVDDKVFMDLRDNILVNFDARECEPDFLNKKIEFQDEIDKKFIKTNQISYRSYRVNPNLPKQCISLSEHQYTYINLPKYNCDSKFYTDIEWYNGIELTEINKAEFESLKSNDDVTKVTYDCGGDSFKQCIIYYKKTKINKNCWTY